MLFRPFLMRIWESQSTSVPTIEFSPFGKLTLQDNGRKWFGLLSGVVPENQVEISIETQADDPALEEKMSNLRSFIENLPQHVERLFEFVHSQFSGGMQEKSLGDLKEMYFLVAIELKSDCKTFWVVLEPGLNVTSIHNHFLRFTIVRDEIGWSNIS